MNGISKKLRELEQNVLALPEDDDINLYVGDESEHLLHHRAEKIKERFRPEAEQILLSGKFTFEQQTSGAEKLTNNLTEHEQTILNNSAMFVRFRLMRLIFKMFKDSMPKIHYGELMNRITWFIQDLDKFVNAKAIEDSEWNFNRDEDDPNFDDYEWWDSVEAKIREYYPKGVFTKESYEAVRDYFDEKASEVICEYWKTHPEDFKEYIEQIDKKLESLKSEQKTKVK